MASLQPGFTFDWSRDATGQSTDKLETFVKQYIDMLVQ